jgi:hypothetical protein
VSGNKDLVGEAAEKVAKAIEAWRQGGDAAVFKAERMEPPGEPHPGLSFVSRNRRSGFARPR